MGDFYAKYNEEFTRVKSASGFACHSRRYSVMVAPLLTGSSQETRARCADLHMTDGILGGSGTPAPDTTSRESDQGPTPALLYARTCGLSNLFIWDLLELGRSGRKFSDCMQKSHIVN